MKTRDSIRLDWLQKHGALINQPSTCEGLTHICMRIPNDLKAPFLHNVKHFYGRTYRKVIDQAMKEIK